MEKKGGTGEIFSVLGDENIFFEKGGGWGAKISIIWTIYTLRGNLNTSRVACPKFGHPVLKSEF